MTAADSTGAFREAIRAAGIEPPEHIEADGQIHRFSTNGKRGDGSGWYVLHGDDPPAGAYGCWRTNISETWSARHERELSEAERQAHRERMETVRRQREAERKRRQDAATEKAAKLWNAGRPEIGEHHYLRDKGVQSHDIRTDSRSLLIPMRDSSGALRSIQYIRPDGGKKYLPGGRVTGCYHSIGRPDGVLCVCEGYATGAMVHETTGYAAAVAFSAGNLLPVAEALREKFPGIKLIVCADDDHATDGNPGITKATEAARAVGGLLAVPDFGADRPEDVTDFNDLAQHRGPEAVRKCIDAAWSTETTETRNGPAELTDAGNAERFIRQHGDDVRYVPEWGWMCWDSKRWARDELRVRERMLRTAREIHKEAAEARDPKAQDAIAAWARKSQSASRLAGALWCAQPLAAGRVDEFDREPWLLPVANGTLDLCSGKLHPHRREHMLTRCSPVYYNADAAAPTWEKFLRRVLPDDDVRAFVQRLAGYSLTGLTSEQKLAFLYGTGRNGKSVFIETLAALLGDYHTATRIDTLAVTRGGGIPNDVAALAGARLVTVSETPEGVRINESLLKDLTGGDTITARFLRCEFFQFQPQFTLLVRGNHKPQIRGTDDGI